MEINVNKKAAFQMKYYFKILSSFLQLFNFMATLLLKKK